jgi:hypothetical protein
MMMNFKRTIQALISVLCITVYAIAALYAGMRVYNECKKQAALAGREYADLKDFAAAAGVLGFTTPVFQDDLKDAVAVSRTLRAIVITGPNNYVFFVEKTPGLIEWDGRNPRFAGGINLLKKTERAPLAIEGFDNVELSALFSVIEFDVLLSILRPSLLGIMIAVVISFAMLIADVSAAKTVADGIVDGDADSDGAGLGDSDSDADSDSGLAVVEEDFLDPDSDDPEKTGAGEDVMDGEDETENTQFDFDDFFTADGHAPPGLPVQPDFPQDEGAEPPPDYENDTFDIMSADADDTAALADAPRQNKGLLTAAAELYETDNFGEFDDEPDFAVELSPELGKAEEADEDLCLLSATWKSPGTVVVGASQMLPPVSPQKVLHDSARKSLKQGTRIFQKTMPGIYAIIPGETIESGFSAAKELFHEVNAQFPESFETGLLIGLSSRAGRKVDSGRLIYETETALFKAREDDDLPIVAFKVDAQKYRAFIERTENAGKG